MNLRHLEAFVAVAEELHFHHAAERLHLTQPAVSRQVAQLEAEVGVKLFARTKRETKLTDAGRAFLHEARGVLDQASKALCVAQQVSRGESGRLRVGHVGSVGYALLNRSLQRFRQRFPALALTVTELSTSQIVDAVRGAELDLALVHHSVHAEGLDEEWVADEYIEVAMPATHPLATRDALTLSELAGEAFVMPPSTETNDPLLALCQKAGFVAEMIHEAYPTSSRVLLVGCGMGVALVSAETSRYLPLQGVVYRPVLDPVATLPLHVAWRKGQRPSTLSSLLEILRAA